MSNSHDFGIYYCFLYTQGILDLGYPSNMFEHFLLSLLKIPNLAISWIGLLSRLYQNMSSSAQLLLDSATDYTHIYMWVYADNQIYLISLGANLAHKMPLRLCDKI